MNDIRPGSFADAASLMPLRIVIIEDDALTATAFAAALDDAGHEVVAIAESALDGLETAEETRADLVLVDITLRDGRTGLAVARALYDEDVATVLISGDANLGAKAAAVNALGYIAKPADANAVARVISNLERRHTFPARRCRRRN